VRTRVGARFWRWRWAGRAHAAWLNPSAPSVVTRTAQCVRPRLQERPVPQPASGAPGSMDSIRNLTRGDRLRHLSDPRPSSRTTCHRPL
jgi:hypothetical protein